MAIIKEKIILIINQWFFSIIGVGLITVGVYAVTAEVLVGKIILEGTAKNILGFALCATGLFFIIFNFIEMRKFRK